MSRGSARGAASAILSTTALGSGVELATEELATGAEELSTEGLVTGTSGFSSEDMVEYVNCMYKEGQEVQVKSGKATRDWGIFLRMAGWLLTLPCFGALGAEVHLDGDWRLETRRADALVD